jgi:manganese/iron transport system permease protein
LTLDWLTEPFALDVQRRALAEIVLAGGLGGLLGSHVVLRRLGFISEAMSHAVLPGVVVAFLVAGAGSVLFGALAAGFAAAIGVGLITRERRVQQDAATGIVLSATFALGVVLISTLHSYATALEDFLFGNVLLVSAQDLALTFGIAALVSASLLVFHRRFLLRAFDPQGSEALGLHGLALDLLLLLLLAGTVVISLRAIGNVLVVAFLITPAATARLLTDRVPSMMVLSATLGALTGATGMVIAYHLDVATSGFIVCLSTAIFLGVLVFEPRRGLLSRRLRPSGQVAAETFIPPAPHGH